MARIASIEALFSVIICVCLNELCDSFLLPNFYHNHNTQSHRCITHLPSSATALDQPNQTNAIEPINADVSNQVGMNEHQLISKFGPAFATKIMELAAYKQQHGNCLVPKRHKENPPLGNFVNKQRQLYRKYLEGVNNSMTQEKIDVLKKLGFAFDTSSIPITKDTSWLRMYNQLTAYHNLHGHSNVPSNTSLGQWCVRQRFMYRSNATDTSLTQDRIEKLNKLGFVFESRYEVLWNKRITELKEFKKLHGHCMVPRNYAENQQLSSWVATQRKHYNVKKRGKKSYLTDERQKQLEDMDFVWSYWDYNFKINEF